MQRAEAGPAGSAPVARASGKSVSVAAHRVKNQGLACVGDMWAFPLRPTLAEREPSSAKARRVLSCLAVDQAGLITEHRPVVDELLHAERRTLHIARSARDVPVLPTVSSPVPADRITGARTTYDP